MSVSIQPTGSALGQDGSIVLLEAPNHLTLVGEDYETLASYKNAREMSAIKFSRQDEKIVLNWHPRGRTDGSNPFEFRYSTTANTSPYTPSNGIVAAIGVKATKDLTFLCEFYAIYECRGYFVSNPSATFVDSREMDLAMNVFRQKKLSGWIGREHHVVEAYNHALVKARHEEQPDSQKWTKLWESAKRLWSFAREVGGF
jgi:hypothetical protein